MKVKVLELKEGENVLEFRETSPTLDLDGLRAEFKSEIPVTLRLHRRENEIVIWAATSGIIAEECSRCLSAFERKFSVEFEIFCDKIGSRTMEEGAARESETFVVFHDGRTLELAPCVREAIVLSLPIKPLCKENCKGLCPVCGTNLNKNTCTCDSRKVDPRWSILEKLKSKKEES